MVSGWGHAKLGRRAYGCRQFGPREGGCDGLLLSDPTPVRPPPQQAYLLLTGRLPYPFWDRIYVQRQVRPRWHAISAARRASASLEGRWGRGSARTGPARSSPRRTPILSRVALSSPPTHLQKVTEKEMFVDICEAPLDFTSPPWDTLSGATPLVPASAACPCLAVPPPSPAAAASSSGSAVSLATSLPPPAAEDAADFVSSLLNRKAHRRPTAEEALQHRWLQPDALRSISGGGSGADVPLSNTIVQRLQRFGTFGRLKRAALRTVATQVPQASCALVSGQQHCASWASRPSAGPRVLPPLTLPSCCRPCLPSAGQHPGERTARPVPGVGPSRQGPRALHAAAAGAGGGPRRRGAGRAGSVGLRCAITSSPLAAFSSAFQRTPPRCSSQEGIFDLTPQECSQLLAQMEMTPDGEITFAEFLASLIDWSQARAAASCPCLPGACAALVGQRCRRRPLNPGSLPNCLHRCCRCRRAGSGRRWLTARSRRWTPTPADASAPQTSRRCCAATRAARCAGARCCCRRLSAAVAARAARERGSSLTLLAAAALPCAGRRLAGFGAAGGGHRVRGAGRGAGRLPAPHEHAGEWDCAKAGRRGTRVRACPAHSCRWKNA